MKIGIITNGLVLDYEFYKPKLKDYDLLICADGGLKHAFKLGVIPQVAIGDFDSTPPGILDYYQKTKCEFIQYAVRKDETDTELALDYALAKNPSDVDVLVGIGTRFDHSLANIHLLKKVLDQGILGRIITENNEIMLVDSDVKIEGEIGEGISLMPLTQFVTHVFTTGLEYPIENGTLEIGKPYGVSNYMTHTTGCIEFKSGLLLVIKYRD